MAPGSDTFSSVVRRFASWPAPIYDGLKIFIPPYDPEIFKRIESALGDEHDFDPLPRGPSGENLIQTYQTRWGILQFHLAVPGVPSFDEAERRAVKIETEDGDLAQCLCLEDLIRAKRAANRPQDQQDIEFLTELLRHNKSTTD